MIPVKTALLQVVVAAALLGPGAGAAVAQERPAKRVADIVGVALAEYEKGIDSAGRLISQLEFEEAVSFLGTARDNAQRLSGTGADSARLALDSLAAAVSRRVPPRSLDRWRDLFLSALGADAALELPTTPVDLVAGERLYAQHCASCHGPRGMADGPASAGMTPPPPALGSAEVMRNVPPVPFPVVAWVLMAATAAVRPAAGAHRRQGESGDPDAGRRGARSSVGR